jgi:hypothetical protein
MGVYFADAGIVTPQGWGEIGLTIVPPMLLAKFAKEVFADNMDDTCNEYLKDEGHFCSGRRNH